MIVIIMGVSGSGKTTAAELLAARPGWTFVDADSFHSPESIARMKNNVPLEDEDRKPWLNSLSQSIDSWIAEKRNVVLACSALKERYRQVLSTGRSQVHIVYLKGSFELIKNRLDTRLQHYMKSQLLESQFDALEEPQDALIVDASLTPEAIIGVIRSELHI